MTQYFPRDNALNDANSILISSVSSQLAMKHATIAFKPHSLYSQPALVILAINSHVLPAIAIVG